MRLFEALAEPARRRIVELLGDGEQTSGGLTAVIRGEFYISQPAVSQHLRVLRETGMVVVRAEGTRRIYALDPEALAELDTWLAQFRDLWRLPLDALATELARGKRARRAGPAAPGRVRHASPVTGRPGR